MRLERPAASGTARGRTGARAARARRAPCALALLLLLLPAPRPPFAQTAAPQAGATPAPPSAPPQGDVAKIDALIDECRQLMSKGGYEEMSAKASEAFELSRRAGDKLRQARSMSYVALAAVHGGRSEDAVEPFRRAAALAGEAGDFRLQTLYLNSAGVSLMNSGRYEEALYFYNQTLALGRQRSDRQVEAVTLRNIGRVYTYARDYPRAEKSLLEALELSRAIGNEQFIHATLMKLAGLEDSRGDLQLALRYAEEAAGIRSPKIDAALRNEQRLAEATLHFRLGHLEQSARLLEEVVESARGQMNAVGERTALGNLSRVQLAMGRPAEALASSARALALHARTGGDPVREALLLHTHAEAQRALGKTGEALSSLRRAIASLERARPLAVPTESSRAELFSGTSVVFLAAIDLLTSAGKADEALAVSESYHGRAFLDSLAESRADLRSVLPRGLLDREEELLSRVSAVQRELWREGVGPERELLLRKDLSAAEDALEAFQVEVRRADPRYARLKYPQPFDAQRVRRELLDAGTALLEYAVGEEKSFAWLVTRDEVSFAPLPGRRELHRLVDDYRNALTEGTTALTAARSLAEVRRQGAHLYRLLVAPFDKQLAARRRLVIVPDNTLAYLPFETLAADPRGAGAAGARGTYLVERFAVAYAPSASALAAIKAAGAQPPAARGFVAFGDPVYGDVGGAEQRVAGPARTRAAAGALDLRRLPYTRKEVTAVGELFPPSERQLFLGAQATEGRVKAERLDAYRYVHFAAHGIVDEENFARSGVFLSFDGRGREDSLLQIAEIMKLRLNADLVTLSACRTGLGKVVRGEGVLGLTRAFIYAGTPTVVASLWNVNDAATAELMKAFYQNLKFGLPKDEALRRAKLQLLRGKSRTWEHPYFWASFVLVGAA